MFEDKEVDVPNRIRKGNRRQRAAHEAFLDLVRTESAKMREVNGFLAGHGLTVPQYNVLRILRGAGGDGLPCGGISARTLTRLPDITRLVDRLEHEGYVARNRGAEDRRVVLIRIRSKGLALLEELDGPILELHVGQFADLTDAELEELGRLLRKARRDDGRESSGSEP